MDGLATTVALLFVFCAAGCSSKSGADPTKAAAALAGGLSAAVALAEADPSPIHCAKLEAGAPGSIPMRQIEGGELTRNGLQLDITLEAKREPRIAVVGDAGGKSERTLATIESLARSWDKGDVSVVFSLGGLAQNEGELVVLLAAMASKRRAVIAQPGNREGVVALDAAVKALREQGLPVFATSEIRIISIAGVAIALLPGVDSEVSLVSGGDGCLHREEDAAALAAALASQDASRVWLSYAAPRQQRALGASDLSVGVHSGERVLTKAITRANAQLIVHAQIEPPLSAVASGKVFRDASEPPMLAVGGIERLEEELGAGVPEVAGVVIHLAPKSLEWRRTPIAPSR